MTEVTMNFRNHKIKIDCQNSAPCYKDTIEYLKVTNQLKSQAQSRKEAAMKQLIYTATIEEDCKLNADPSLCKLGENWLNIVADSQYIQKISDIKKYVAIGEEASIYIAILSGNKNIDFEDLDNDI